jgi:hypothetical protein
LLVHPVNNPNLLCSAIALCQGLLQAPAFTKEVTQFCTQLFRPGQYLWNALSLPTPLMKLIIFLAYPREFVQLLHHVNTLTRPTAPNGLQTARPKTYKRGRAWSASAVDPQDLIAALETSEMLRHIQKTQLHPTHVWTGIRSAFPEFPNTDVEQTMKIRCRGCQREWTNVSTLEYLQEPRHKAAPLSLARLLEPTSWEHLPDKHCKYHCPGGWDNCEFTCSLVPQSHTVLLSLQSAKHAKTAATVPLAPSNPPKKSRRSKRLQEQEEAREQEVACSLVPPVKPSVKPSAAKRRVWAAKDASGVKF